MSDATDSTLLGIWCSLLTLLLAYQHSAMARARREIELLKRTVTRLLRS